MSLARQFRLPVSLLVLVLVVAGSLTRVDLWLPPMLRAEVCDGLHVPMGMLLCFVASLWLPVGPRSLLTAIMLVLVGSTALEMIQSQVGRSASWRDILLSTAGAALAAAILYYRSAGKPGLKRPLASLGVALFVVATLPVMNKLAAIEEGRALWPQLANFESLQQDVLWQPYHGAVITHAEHGELQTSMGMLDQSYLRVDGRTASPVFRHWVVSADWSSMKTFCLEARYPQPAILKVVFHDGDPLSPIAEPEASISAGLPVVDYVLTPFWKRHCTPVAALGADGGRLLLSTGVRAITFFVQHDGSGAGVQAPARAATADPVSATPAALPGATGQAGHSTGPTPEPFRLDIDNVRLY